jgi:hypothetical protein
MNIPKNVCYLLLIGTKRKKTRGPKCQKKGCYVFLIFSGTTETIFGRNIHWIVHHTMNIPTKFDSYWSSGFRED